MEKLRSNTDKLVICGQALSHCVNYTVRDIVSYWNISSATANLTATADGDDDEKKEMRNNKNNNITILKDCASSVPGFEEAGEQFLKDMIAVGVNVETSDSFMP